MDRSVARLNIEHYRQLLATETDEARRLTLLRLLSEEEAKLADPGPPATTRLRRAGYLACRAPVRPHHGRVGRAGSEHR